MNARLPLLALFLFSLCCVSNAATETWSWTVASVLTAHSTPMYIIVAIGSLIGMILAVLGYYVAITTNDERGKSAAISEIKSTLINIFLFAFVIGLILSINNVFSVISGMENGELINETTKIYEGNINNMMTVVQKTIPFHVYASQLESSSSSISTGFPLPWGFAMTANTGKTTSLPVLGRLSRVTASFIVTLTSISSQQALLMNIMRFFVTISCTLLLPLGFFLRAIPYLRRVGSTLVSIGIALVIVYPLAMYVLGSIFIGVQDASIKKMFGANGFNPESRYSGFLSSLQLSQLTLRGLTKAYVVLGNTITIANVYVKGGVGITLAAFLLFIVTIPLSIAGQPIAASAFLVTDIALTTAGTGIIHGLYELWSYTAMNFLLKGSVEDSISLGIDLANFGTIVNMTHILILASVVLSVLGVIRSLAVLLGGEFFLYGVQDYL